MKTIPVLISHTNSSLSVIPSEGGRIDRLKLNGKLIIDSLPIPYAQSYSASILFPFVNRIENGKYGYDGKCFELDKNLFPNAIHGLVYNKPFKIQNKNEDNNNCSITLNYSDDGIHKGYPFKYNLELTYILKASEFVVSLKIVNLDSSIIPFNVGWHPYFYSSNLSQSKLKLNSSHRCVLNDHLIPKGVEEEVWGDYIVISGTKFDDCFKLKQNTILFKTPDYHIELSSNLKHNYLQIYTPDQRNYIALEPMSAVSNSFNNNIGLMELEPNTSFSVEWKIKLI